MSEHTSEEIKEEIKEVVIARIEASTSNLKLAIGSGGSLTKEQMINHVKKGDEVGEQIVKTHLSFLKAISSGQFTKAITSVEY